MTTPTLEPRYQITSLDKVAPESLDNNICYATPLEQLSILSVAGKDAATFLQGQLSCDVTAVHTNQASFGTYCNIKGRVLASFILLEKSAETYWLITATDNIETLQTTLEKYALFSKVTCEKQRIDCLGLINSDVLISKQTIPSQNKLHVSQQEDAIYINYSQQSHRQLVLVEKENWNAFAKHVLSHVSIIHPDSWMALDILEKIPSIYADTSEQFTPHDAGFVELDAVSFKKGCYLGQEIIARMEYLGKVKKCLCVLRTKGKPCLQPNEAIIINQKTLGHVLLSVNLSDGEGLLLAVLRKEAIPEIPSQLVSEDGLITLVANDTM